MFKQLVKASLTHLIALVGPHVWPAFQPKLLIVMYHRILPPDDPRYNTEQSSMIVHPDTFSKHIKWLKQYFTMVDLDDWLKCAATNQPLPKKACAITFDDGWQDNYQYAYPALVKENCPATIYLVSDYIDSHEMFWPEKLIKVLTTTALSQPELFNHNAFSWLKNLNCSYQFNASAPEKHELDEIINAAKKHDDIFLHAAIKEIATLANISLQFEDILSAKQIQEMFNSGVISFGCHTATHTRMSDNLTNDVLNYELVQSKQSLENKYNLKIHTFCYPNGDTAKSADIIIKEHYQAAVTTQKKWNTLRNVPYALNRTGVHESSANTKQKFFTKLSGLL